MANRFQVAIILGGLLAIGIGCGGTDDESRLMPTPTQGPPTPTPLPICRGVDVPTGGLGCRPFTWTQPISSNNSGTQLFSTVPSTGGFDFLPSLVPNGIDPGGSFIDLPPGLALVGGLTDPETGVTAVTIGVAEENQPVPGFVIIGIKPILDYICLKIELETVRGELYCDGNDTQGIDTRITAEAGVTPQEDDVLEFPIGDSTAAGGLFLRVIQQQGRILQASDPRYETCFNLPECEPGQRFDCYRPAQEVAFTTGTAFGMKGDTPLLNANGEPGLSGEPFSCAAWTETDGPGQIVQGLADFDIVGGNVATALRIDD